MTSICGRNSFLLPEDLTEDWVACCIGSAMRGPDGCTCWRDRYDAVQQPAVEGAVRTTRRTRCHDCAFRPDSPEREDGLPLEELPNFACHQGMVRVVGHEHPDGRYREALPGDYAPAIHNGMALKADGTPADACAGHAQAQRRLQWSA